MIVKMLVMDVDGTLTDGKIYIGANGELMKAFDVKDGYAIVHLKKYGIEPVIITGRVSKIVENRANELGIKELYQGVSNKIEILKDIMNKYSITKENIAYIGDDLNDIDCIQFCGLSACPKNAVEDVKNVVNYICHNNGGSGAVREFIEMIKKDKL